MKNRILGMACVCFMLWAQSASGAPSVTYPDSTNFIIRDGAFWDDSFEYLDSVSPTSSTSSTYSFDYNSVTVPSGSQINNPYIYLYILDNTTDDGQPQNANGYITDTFEESIDIYINGVKTSYPSATLNLNNNGFYEVKYYTGLFEYINTTSPIVSVYAEVTEGDITIYNIYAGGEIVTKPTPTSPVPEPTTMLLFGAGLAGLALTGRRKTLQ